MQSHDDRDWMRSLSAKAERMKTAGQSEITGGKADETPLATWKSNGVAVVHRPPDEHGVLRISVGGGKTPVPCNYCVFRGDHGACVDLLRAALAALEAGPS